jgi:hypothetical protein
LLAVFYCSIGWLADSRLLAGWLSLVGVLLVLASQNQAILRTFLFFKKNINCGHYFFLPSTTIRCSESSKMGSGYQHFHPKIDSAPLKAGKKYSQI